METLLKNSPNILIRGQKEDIGQGFLEPVEEDINEDRSSIWIVSDQKSCWIFLIQIHKSQIYDK